MIETQKLLNPMKTIITLFLLCFTAFTAMADTATQRQKHYNLKNHLGIQGYDPVSYFSGNPQKGNSAHAQTVKGVTYHFVSAANASKFKSNPAKYEPQFGGWCAYAFAEKAGKVKINPKSYKIISGKLYLFYRSAPWGNTLKKWNKNSDAAQIKVASSEWSKFVG